jgi:hemerythrin
MTTVAAAARQPQGTAASWRGFLNQSAAMIWAGAAACGDAMLFQWSDEIAIGVATIDDDHRRLIDIISRFHELADSGRIDAMRDTIASLRQHAIDHFDREEELQRRVGYPAAEAHAAQHRDMLAALDALASRLTAPEGADMGKTLREETSVFLIQWLTRHVLRADLDMVPYGRAMRDAQQAPTQALPEARDESGGKSTRGILDEGHRPR